MNKPKFKKGDEVYIIRLGRGKEKGFIVEDAIKTATESYMYIVQTPKRIRYEFIHEDFILKEESILSKFLRKFKESWLYNLFKRQPPIIIDIKVNKNKHIVKFKFSNY